jgi:serine/threonine protein kinase
MEHPKLLILGCGEMRTPELESTLQLTGWDTVWTDEPNGQAGSEEFADGFRPVALVANSGRADSSLQAVRDFKSKDPFVPVILVGDNDMTFPIGAEAFIPRSSNPDTWAAALKPFLPESMPQKSQVEEISEPFGKYRLTQKIASGGMADIYKAEQIKPEGFKRDLAIKRIKPQHQQDQEYIKMMLAEANLAACLDHQNIARVIDFGEEGGTYYLALEYVDGPNLRVLISNAKSLGISFPEPVAAYFIAQTAQALDYAHHRAGSDGRPLGILHRDISPQNILVNKVGQAKLIDFGIARAKSGAEAQSQEPGGQDPTHLSIQGKLMYMSPEQSLGAEEDMRSDIFSLGLVLFEMLASEPCYQEDQEGQEGREGDEQSLLQKVRAGMTRGIKEVKQDASKPMARILERALERNPTERYGSALQMAHDLTAYLAHLHLESLDAAAADFIAALCQSQPQAKAIAARFPPFRGNMALPSEKEKKDADDTHKGSTAFRLRPVWIMPAINALLVLLTILLWISMHA